MADPSQRQLLDYGTAGRKGMGQLRPWLMPAAVLLLLNFIVFGRILGHNLLNWDDLRFILHNPCVAYPSWLQLARAWWGPWAGIYVPVTINVWMLLAIPSIAIGKASYEGMHPLPFHLASIVVHTMVSLLVWRLTFVAGASRRTALLGAAIFALHPIQVEAVAWASGLKDLLGAMLGLMALLCYLRSSRYPTDPRRQQVAWYLLAMLLTWAAVLSKPGVVVLPALACIADWLLTGRRVGKSILRVLPLAAVVMPAVLWTLSAQQAKATWAGPVLARPFIAAHALGMYVQHILWPSGLAIDYSLKPLNVLTDAHAFWMPVLAAAALGSVLLAPRECRRVLFGASLFAAVSMATVLGLVRFEFQRVSTVADHYVYLGMAGLAIVVATLVDRFPRLYWPAWGAVVLLGVLSVRQAGYWRNDTLLMEHAMAVNPRSVVANSNKVGGSYSQLRPLIAKAQSGEMTPEELSAYVKWLGDECRRVLRLDPDNEVVLRFLISQSLYAEQTWLACAYSEELLRIGMQYDFDPEELAEQAFYLGDRYLKLGNPERGRDRIELAVRLNPNYRPARRVLRELESGTTRPTTEIPEPTTQPTE